MADLSKPIASWEAELYIAPSDGQGKPVLMAFVEDFSPGNNYNSENLMGIGAPTAQDSVVNNWQGRFSWGRVHTQVPEVVEQIRPTKNGIGKYKKFDLLAIRPDGTPIALAKNCRPAAHNLQMTNGRALRENFQGICEELRVGPAQINKAQ